MCLAIPVRLTAIDGTNGTVELDGIVQNIRLDLLENPRLNSYVIVHAGFALRTLDDAEATETLELLSQLSAFADSPP